MVNILAYVDDLVLMAPSYCFTKVTALELNIDDINVQYNID